MKNQTVDNLEYFALPVESIAYSSDVSGPLSGYLTTTIKTQHCSLNCENCTNSELQKPKTTYYHNLKDIFNKVIMEKTKYVKIVGGDPLLYRDELIYLMKSLIEHKKYIFLYLTGIQDIKDFLNDFWSEEQKKIIIILNWKSISSGESSKMIHDNLKYLRKNDVLTFRIQDSEDLNQMNDIVKQTKCKNVFVRTMSGFEYTKVISYIMENVNDLGHIRLW